MFRRIIHPTIKCGRNGEMKIIFCLSHTYDYIVSNRSIIKHIAFMNISNRPASRVTLSIMYSIKLAFNELSNRIFLPFYRNMIHKYHEYKPFALFAKKILAPYPTSIYFHILFK